MSREKSIGLVTWRVLVGLSLVPDATQRELVEFSRTEQAQPSRILQEKHRALLPQVKHLTDAMDDALNSEERVEFLSMCERIAMAERKAAAYRQDHSGQP